MVMWSARLRDPNLGLLDEVKFNNLTLVKNYNAPSTLVLAGQLNDLRIAMQPGYGLVVRNEDGQQFSGFLSAAQRNGDGTGTATFTGDLAKLWGRICYPSPGFAWDGQTLATDHVSGTIEARILSLVNRNAGPAAWYSTVTGTDPGQTNTFTQWKTIFTNNRDRVVETFVENPNTHDIFVWQVVSSTTSAIVRCDSDGTEQDRMTLTGGGSPHIMYLTTNLAKQNYLTFPYGSKGLGSSTPGTWVKLLYVADTIVTAAAAKAKKVAEPKPTKVTTTTTTSAGVVMNIGYGNLEGGYTLTEKNWDGRIDAQVTLIKSMGVDVFAATEVHEETDSSFGTAQSGIVYFLNKLKANAASDWALFVGNEGNHLYYRTSKWSAGSTTHYNMDGGRDLTSFPLIDATTGTKVRVFVTHFYSNDDNGKSRDTERRKESQYVADLVARTAGPLIVTGDFNTDSTASPYIKYKLKKLGLTGMREHGRVINGTKGTNTSGKRWIEDIYSRTTYANTNSELVPTKGASDHDGWLRTSVEFPGTGGTVTQITYTPINLKPAPARRAGCKGETTYDGYVYRLYGTPYNNTGSTVSPAVPAFVEVIYDGQILRTVPVNFLGRGQDGNPYDAYLEPAGLQFATVNNQPCLIIGFRTGTSTAKLIGLRLYSLPVKPAARGAEDRRVSGMRMPASRGRGATGTTDARFDILGVLCAKLAESADLGMNLEHAYDGRKPYLEFFLSDAPDLSDTIRVGPPEMGGPVQLGTDWTYTAAYPTVTTGLAGAGGLGSDRILRYKIDTDAEDAWDTRVETFIDMSGQTDQSDIDDNILKTILDGSNPSTISVTLGDSELRWGSDVPLGSRILAVLDGQTVVDRVRQLTTVVGGGSGQAREVTTAVMGSSDAPLKTPTQKAMAAMLRRLQNLERS